MKPEQILLLFAQLSLGEKNIGSLRPVNKFVDQGWLYRLKNLEKLMTEETGVPAHVADEPLLCVVRGTGLVLENIELWRRSISTRG